MYINGYSNRYQSPNFGARFLHSDDLARIAQYACDNKKFDKLNEARKKLDATRLTSRLYVEVGTLEKGNPFVKFFRYQPKKNVIVAKKADDYEIVKVVVVSSSNVKENPLAFALKQIIKLANGMPNGNLFKRLF